MRIGLFFGSFNPIHTGHLIIANYMVEMTELEQLWFVVSPQNPFKQKSSLLNEYDRLHLVELAIADNDRLRASNVEFSLPVPSYTVDTLAHLKDKFPRHEFSLLMGGDNLAGFTKWKNYETILEHYSIVVYERPGYERTPLFDHPKVTSVEVPLLHVSASFIRDSIKDGKSMKYFLPEPVWQYIQENNLYK